MNFTNINYWQSQGRKVGDCSQGTEEIKLMIFLIL